MQKRRVPLRKCMGCKQMKPKKELVRVVKSPQGEVSLNLTGRKPGRGAYVCNSVECLKIARKEKGFERAFEAPIPDEVFQQMEKELAGDE